MFEPIRICAVPLHFSYCILFIPSLRCSIASRWSARVRWSVYSMEIFRRLCGGWAWRANSGINFIWNFMNRNLDDRYLASIHEAHTYWVREKNGEKIKEMCSGREASERGTENEEKETGSAISNGCASDMKLSWNYDFTNASHIAAPIQFAGDRNVHTKRWNVSWLEASQLPMDYTMAISKLQMLSRSRQNR